MPLDTSTLYECPRCGAFFEAFTFAKSLACPYCNSRYAVSPDTGQKHKKGIYKVAAVMVRKK